MNESRFDIQKVVCAALCIEQSNSFFMKKILNTYITVVLQLSSVAGVSGMHCCAKKHFIFIIISRMKFLSLISQKAHLDAESKSYNSLKNVLASMKLLILSCLKIIKQHYSNSFMILVVIHWLIRDYFHRTMTLSADLLHGNLRYTTLFLPTFIPIHNLSKYFIPLYAIFLLSCNCLHFVSCYNAAFLTACYECNLC